MAWPTSSAEPASGVRLRARTTLTDLRSRPVTDLPGVGPRIEAALKELGVTSLADMVSHYPSRHEDLSNVKGITGLCAGAPPASLSSSTMAQATSPRWSGGGAGS